MPDPRLGLVTGASRNIGRAIALALAEAGHDVVVNAARDRAGAEEVAAAVRDFGKRAWVCLADVSDPDAVDRLKNEVLEQAGRVDVLVNNAAVRPDCDFLDLEPRDWRRVLGVILDGAYLCTRAFLPGMLETRWGRIVNVIGVRGEQGAARRAHVVAAKSGLVGLTRALAHEFGPASITVNAVSPGTTVTDRDRDDPERLRARAHLQVLPEAVTPESIAYAVAFLASDRAAHITGQVLGVNGGERMA